MTHGKHTRNPGYEPGNHWVVCDRCGFDYRAEDVIEEWTGAVVCRQKCWEPRHPQDFVRAVEDDMTPTGPIRTDALEADAVSLKDSEQAEGSITETTFGSDEIDKAIDTSTNPVPTHVAPHYEGNDASNTNPQNNSVNQKTDGEAVDTSVDYYSDDIFEDVTYDANED